eukprot:SAG11_NODE_4705_length_1797_cov_1.498233_1_plen_117_part_10
MRCAANSARVPRGWLPRQWYGGSELQPSYVALLGWLQTNLTQADPVLFVDVHTGLGPAGRDTMLCDGGAESVALWQRVFGPPTGEDVRPRRNLHLRMARRAQLSRAPTQGDAGGYIM